MYKYSYWVQTETDLDGGIMSASRTAGPVFRKLDVFLLTIRQDDVCGHHFSWMSASRSVQLLETELSLSPVLDCGKSATR